MIRLLGPGGVVMMLLWIYAVFDVIATDEVLVRNLPKWPWLFLVVFVPFIGPIAWLVLGRPQYAGIAPGGGGQRRQGPPPNVRTYEYERPTPTSTPIPELTDERLEAWQDDLARREAAMRESASAAHDTIESAQAPAAPAVPAGPPPRWWRAEPNVAAHSVLVADEAVVALGRTGVEAFSIATGARLWASDHIADDGSGVGVVRDDVVEYWTSTDCVSIDIATGEVTGSLDGTRPRPSVDRRVVLNGWMIDNTDSTRLKTPDGRRWKTADTDGGRGSVPIVAGDWVTWVTSGGAVHRLDTSVRTAVTAVQALGYVLA